MGTVASQITGLRIIYSTVYSGADQRKHQSSASLAFVREIHLQFSPTGVTQDGDDISQGELRLSLTISPMSTNNLIDDGIVLPLEHKTILY